MYVTARVEDNDSAVDDDVRREVSDITASLTQIVCMRESGTFP